MELRDYLRIVRRRWAMILTCTLLAITAAGLITVQATPLYQSTARLFVSTPQTGAVEAYSGGLFSQQRVQSYANLITGEQVAQRVIDDLGLNTTANELSAQMTSSVTPETVILEVSVTDPRPRRAQLLTTTAAQEFTQLVPELETAPGQRQSPIKATVVDSADLPTTPVSPQPARNIGLAAVLGLLLGIGLAVLREMLDVSVKSGDDLSELTSSSLLGTIPFDSHAQKQPLMTSLGSHAPRVEAFRMLRTNLQFVDIDQSSKTFVVASSLPQEGKTTTATNLAIAVAQANQRVALVEADLRRPKVSEYLRLEAAVGVTTILIGRASVEDALQTWGDSGLAVLTSGAIPPNPAELLQSHAMADLLADLRKRFEVIIIDAPPLLPVTDTALLTAQADGAILVVRHGKTTRDEVQQSVDRITAVGGRLLGTVLNMAPVKGPDAYSYGYGYAPESARRRLQRAPNEQFSDSR